MTISATTPPGGVDAQDHDEATKLSPLVVGTLGVVFGDIGTSPLYAFRESIGHTVAGDFRQAVVGIVSLLIWAVIVTVTIKYVLVIMRADNKGEGGTLSLMALAQHALGKRTQPLLMLGVVGAALFYSDAVLTPAISVLSAVEGLKHVTPVFEPVVVPIAVGILVGLFMAQKNGTGRVAALFGPVMIIWFLSLAVLGLV
ncbi:MAG: potassium transporter Kup, partial [Hyphomicrobiaceae bacterium]